LGRAERSKNRWRTLALWIMALTFIGVLIAVLRL
jgi:ubiquinone biosynthesis protein